MNKSYINQAINSTFQAAPEPVRAVQASVDQLSIQLDALENTVVTLRTRLQSVLRQEPEGSRTCAARPEITTPLADSIQSRAYRVAASDDVLRSILELLEV